MRLLLGCLLSGLIVSGAGSAPCLDGARAAHLARPGPPSTEVEPNLASGGADAAASPQLARAALQRGRAAAPQGAAGRTWDERRITLPIVGAATAYVPHTPPGQVVLLISGDAGWTIGMVDLARRLASKAVVVGLSFPAIRRTAERGSGCWYVASDLELLSHAAQKALKLAQYQPPILIGYASGATLVYAALAGAPAVTFAGGISLAFCPELRVAREVCAGDDWQPDYNDRTHLSVLPPSRQLPREWIVLHGSLDRVCSLDQLRRFTQGLPRTNLTAVEDVDHEPSPSARWAAPVDQALNTLLATKEVQPAAAEPRSATTADLESALMREALPFEYRWPAQLSALLLFFSGDGGWASLDEGTAEHLVTQGVGVVGVSSLRYFWNARRPSQVAADIRRLTDLLGRSGRPVFVGGFSFGADIVPVAIAQWRPEERHTLAGLVLIGSSPSASFEIDPLDWVRAPAVNPLTLVAPAVRAVGLPTLCLAGTAEDDTPCPSLVGAPGVRVVRLPGSHHFNGDYQAVGTAVATFIHGITDRRP